MAQGRDFSGLLVLLLVSAVVAGLSWSRLSWGGTCSDSRFPDPDAERSFASPAGASNTTRSPHRTRELPEQVPLPASDPEAKLLGALIDVAGVSGRELSTNATGMCYRHPLREFAVSYSSNSDSAGGHIFAMVVAVPDPRNGQMATYFDQTLEALVDAAGEAGFVKDRYFLPWQRSVEKASQDAGGEADPNPTSVGFMLFRSASSDRAGSADLIAFLLVGESIARGVEREDALQAIDLARRATTDPSHVYVVAPFFSGSAASWAKSMASGRPGEFRVVTGTATASGVASTMGATGAEFYRTVAEDEELMDYAFCQIAKLYPTSKSVKIAQLAEIGTTYGAATTMGQGPSPDSPRPDQKQEPAWVRGLEKYLAPGRRQEPAWVRGWQEERLARCQKPPDVHWCPSDKGNAQHRVAVHHFGFPLHVSQLLAERQRMRDAGRDRVGGLRRTLELRLDPKEDPKPEVDPTQARAPIFSQLTPYNTELTLRQLFYRICGGSTEYMMLVGTDPTDLIFLAQETRKYCPNVTLVMQEADILYSHPDLRDVFSGAMVATTYPLLFETRDLTERSQRHPFASAAATGFHNALSVVLNEMLPRGAETDRSRLSLYDYSAPTEEGGKLGPQLWLTTIANGRFWPLATQPAKPKKSYWRGQWQTTTTDDRSCLSARIDDRSCLSAARGRTGVRPRAGLLASLIGAVSILGIMGLHVLLTLVRFGPVRASAPRADQADSREVTKHNHIAQFHYWMVTCAAIAGMIVLILPAALWDSERSSGRGTALFSGALVCVLLLLILALVPVRSGATELLHLAFSVIKPLRQSRFVSLISAARKAGSRSEFVSQVWLLLRHLITPGLWVFILIACGVCAYDWHMARGVPKTLLVLRSMNPLGMSPLSPVFCVAAGLYLWGVTGLRRLSALLRHPSSVPIPSESGDNELTKTLGELQAFWREAPTRPRLSQLLLWVVGAVVLFLLYWRMYPEADDPKGLVHYALFPAALLTLYFVLCAEVSKPRSEVRLGPRPELCSWLLRAGLLGFVGFFYWGIRPSWALQSYDQLLLLGLCTLYCAILCSFARFVRLWQLLAAFLRQVVALPMVDACDRVAVKVGASFGLQLGARMLNASELELSVYNLRLLASGAGTAIHPALYEGRSGLGVDNLVLAYHARRLEEVMGLRPRSTTGNSAHFSESESAVHDELFAASRVLFSLLRQIWSRRTLAPETGEVLADRQLEQLLPGGEAARIPTAALFMRAVPPETYLWTRMAEDFVALRIATFIHHTIFQLRNLLLFALFGSLILVLATLSYPLQPSRVATVVGWLPLVITMLGSAVVIVSMERNETLRRLSGVGLGNITLNPGLWSQLLIYVLLPFAAVLVHIFPELGDLFFSWIHPLAQLLPQGG